MRITSLMAAMVSKTTEKSRQIAIGARLLDKLNPRIADDVRIKQLIENAQVSLAANPKFA
jgi:hypothetical protein